MNPERLRWLELRVAGRVEGLLQGDYRGLLPGPGGEAGDARPYLPGDDPRRIDWNVTARAQQTYVRDTTADHELETTLVVDVSASMAFGTGLVEKRDIALEVAAVFGFLTARGGNRTGAVIVGETVRIIPPRSGRYHVYRLLGAIGASGRDGPPADLGGALRRLAEQPARRGLVVVISDFIGPEFTGHGGWERSLRSLATRHDLLAVEVTDEREERLPAVGVVRMEDPETGKQALIDTSDRRYRQRFQSAAAERSRAVATALRRAGASHLRLSTDRDHVEDLVEWVLGRRRRRALGGRSA